MSKNVFIVDSGADYRNMFKKAGWTCVDNIRDADLVQFTGGEDVHPSLYGEHLHASTVADIRRDIFEKMIYKVAKDSGTPMAGICRGGQFLNVMAGGKMWQNVNNHRIKHEAECQLSDDKYEVSSMHHQMMIPASDAVHILHADASTMRSRMGANQNSISNFTKIDFDVEALFYPENNLFCFQPHPEMPGYDKLAGRYFDFLDYLVFNHL